MSREGAARRAVPLGAVALVAFIAGVVAWFPARWATSALPRPFSCEQPAGTIWSGHCADFRHGAGSVGAVSWRLRATPLLRGVVAAEVAWTHRASRLSGELEVARAHVLLRGLRGTADVATLRALPVWPPSLVAAWPPSEGRLRIDLGLVELRESRLARIAGVIDVDGLVSSSARWSLGDYRLAWREGAAPLGELADRGGPLELMARLEPAGLDGAAAPPGGAWRLQGTVRARDRAWAPRLAVFGPPDAAGRHTLSIEWR